MRILLLGGNRSNVPSLRALRRAGVETVVTDRNPQAAGLGVASIPLYIDLVDVDALVPAIHELGGVDGVVSMSEVGVRSAARLADRLHLPGISIGAAQAASSKLAMRKAWEGEPFSVPYRTAASLDEVRAAVSALDFPLVFKPDRSLGGSRGVSTVLRPDEVEPAYRFALQEGMAGTSVVIERRVVGQEYSAEVLIWQGQETLLCAGQKVKSPAPYRVDLAVRYPAPFTAAQQQTVATTCGRAVRQVGLHQGLAHVEFCLHPEGITVFELGARCGGGHTPLLTPHVSGVDELLEACRMACGQAPEHAAPRWQKGGEYRFLTFRPGRVRRTTVPAAVSKHPQVVDAAIVAEPGTDIVSVHTASDRSGYVVTIGATAQQAAELADWGAAEVSVEYEDGRVEAALPLPP